jgi:hypothetical protein
MRALASRLSLLTMPLLMASSTGSIAAETPRAFLAGIYTQYTDEEAPVLVWNGEDAARVFEPALARAITRDVVAVNRRGGAPRLDSDPFKGGHDYGDIRSLSIAILESKSASSNAIVRFRIDRRPIEIRFELIPMGRSWRIRDMRWAQRSLRAIYGLN